MNDKFSRRNFLKTTAAGALGLSVPGMALGASRTEWTASLEDLLKTPPRTGKSVIGLTSKPLKPVRVGFIGLGNRGKDHITLVNALCPEMANIVAIGDVESHKTNGALEIIKATSSGQKPEIYDGKENEWKKLARRDDIDLVIISTPWLDHAPMAVYCMEQGKHVGLEVPCALTVDECWDLVDTAEQHQVNCMILENVCYGDEELWLLNMAENGVFGTLTYAEGAYIHDLKELMFSRSYYYNQWRIRYNMEHDGNLYPTHGLGPIAQYMGINRGDAFNHLVSMSSLQAGLSTYSKTLSPDDEFYDKTAYKHGDINYTIVKTTKGRTILIKHDVVTYRPYSRINALAGTLGYHEGYPSRLALKENGHGWLTEEKYNEYWNRYNHPIWKKLEAEIQKYGGHGGMDFVMIYRLIDCLNRGVPLDMDVYDSASWSAIIPLSELSCNMGSVPVQIPDFTRGGWKNERKLGITDVK